MRRSPGWGRGGRVAARGSRSGRARLAGAVPVGALWILLAGANGPARAQEGAADLEALIGWPFPSGLVAAEAAPVVACNSSMA